MWTRITPNTDTFYAVIVSLNFSKYELLKLANYCFLSLAYLRTCLKQSSFMERKLFLNYFLLFDVNAHLADLFVELTRGGSFVGHLHPFCLH